MSRVEYLENLTIIFLLIYVLSCAPNKRQTQQKKVNNDIKVIDTPIISPKDKKDTRLDEALIKFKTLNLEMEKTHNPLCQNISFMNLLMIDNKKNRMIHKRFEQYLEANPIYKKEISLIKMELTFAKLVNEIEGLVNYPIKIKYNNCYNAINQFNFNVHIKKISVLNALDSYATACGGVLNINNNTIVISCDEN